MLTISTAAIITCNRVTALTRGLTSYLENARRHRRQVEFVVMDDSPAAEVRRSCRELVRALGAQSRLPIRYAGLEEKARFAGELGRATGVSTELLRFALFDLDRTGLPTMGANMNALLLHSAGTAVFATDDDTVCRPALPPDHAAGTDLVDDQPCSSSHPYDVRTFPTDEEAIEATSAADVDALAAHEEILARPVPELRAGEGRVRVSLNGLVGDCGWGSPSSYLFLTGAGRERWLSGDEEGYRAVATRRSMARTVPRLTLSTSTHNLMTPFFAFDNQILLPPFLPVARGSDHLFGLTISRCRQDAVFAHLPSSLLHRPVDPRSFSKGELARSAPGLDLASLVAALVSSGPMPDGPLDPAGSLAILGRHLRSMAEDFEGEARRRALEAQAARLDWLERQVAERAGEPRRWAADVGSFLARARGAARREAAGVPLDLLYLHRPERAVGIARRIVLMFGRLLEVWPRLVEAARALRQGGCWLAVPP